MVRRLERTARHLGVPDHGRALVLQAFSTAMEPRRRLLTDDHHPDYLHPARTALILMDDVRESDPMVLAMAVFCETRDKSLAAVAEKIEATSPAVAQGLAGIPLPSEEGETLMESLLALSPGQSLVAVAERLDHARHLHLRDRNEWSAYHATTCAVYAPVAGRVHATLGDRLDWWCSTFRRRYLQG